MFYSVLKELKEILTHELRSAGGGISFQLFSELVVTREERGESQTFKMFIQTSPSLNHSNIEMDAKIRQQLSKYTSQLQNLFTLEGSGAVNFNFSHKYTLQILRNLYITYQKPSCTIRGFRIHQIR